MTLSSLAQVNAGLKVYQGADGFSYKLDGSQPARGYAVALSGQPVFRVTEFSRYDRQSVVRALNSWLKENATSFGEDTLLGGWYDQDNDVYEVEPSTLVSEKRRAVRLAKLHNQIAIFNLKDGVEIPTGGNGNR